MTREQIKARLKAKFPDVNLSNARLDAIADKLAGKVTDETQTDERLDALNDVLPFAEIAKTDDRLRNLEAKTKTPSTEPTTTTPTTTTPQGDDMPAWAKALLGEVQSLKADKQAQTIQQKITGHEKIKAIPSTFWGKRALPKTDEEIDAFVSEVETDFTTLQQDLINQGLATTTKPVTGVAGNDKAVDADIAAWASKGKEATTK